MAKHTGSCLCGSIKYEIEGEPFRTANCHCDDCRKATGASHATNLFFQKDQITVLEGTPKKFQHVADSGNSMTKEFCENCGSQLFGTGSLRPGVMHVKVGTIDDASFAKPEVNLYVTHALSCCRIDDSIQSFAGMPPPA